MATFLRLDGAKRGADHPPFAACCPKFGLLPFPAYNESYLSVARNKGFFYLRK